ncbi:ferric reductase transmembrane protein-like protein [Leptomonas seymouri]|uniref:Ferric reductase transmembrane protein-like protein n=1 Tax=Leptomonas seymouri TaxID=5684 RepID=A0A0N1PE39_LEPSE|nr:ferric reductase transmembrane protein-like protein [Leptomonas seymouri]|eukprot:KPI90164.1 ferric reductase transmembrane protein-like protein [Leptomonas seymouri]
MGIPDIHGVLLTKKEVIARCRSRIATTLIFLVTVRLFYYSCSYANAMQFHPMCMLIAFVLVLPDVVSSFKRLQIKGNASLPGTKNATQRQPLDSGIPRGEVVLRHQLAAFALGVAAAGGGRLCGYRVCEDNQRLPSHEFSPCHGGCCVRHVNSVPDGFRHPFALRAHLWQPPLQNGGGRP